MDENDIDVLLYWDSSDLKMEMVNGALQKQDWNSDKFWNAKFANMVNLLNLRKNLKFFLKIKLNMNIYINNFRCIL